MAKTYIDTVKYIITANFAIDGLVEKPDIIGAIFGQTEGLVGDELELRELQKNGKIGRIEVDYNVKNGKTSGKIIIPSSLDKIETVVLGAALEVVDKVGPCAADINVEKIEDTRSAKRGEIIEKAKQLLKKMEGQVPETQEITSTIQSQIRQAEVETYGPEKLACGPEINDAPSVIVVEGRADVLNLLRHGIKNVICTGGAKVPKSIIDLGKKKSLTVFLDGDRGGDLILKALNTQVKIDYVAKAPDGKEVEELMGKEILQALRRKITPDEYKPGSQGSQKRQEQPQQAQQQKSAPQKKEFKRDPKKEEQLKETLTGLSGSLNAMLLSEDLKVLDEVPVRKLMNALENKDNVYAVVFDGIITNRLTQLATKKNVNYVVGIKEGRIENKPKDLILLTNE